MICSVTSDIRQRYSVRDEENEPSIKPRGTKYVTSPGLIFVHSLLSASPVSEAEKRQCVKCHPKDSSVSSSDLTGEHTLQFGAGVKNLLQISFRWIHSEGPVSYTHLTLPTSDGV